MDLKKLNFPDREFNEKRVCDDCTKELDEGDYAVEYFSDNIWMQSEQYELPRPATHEVYCLYCYPDEVPIPHKGTNEGFIFVTVEFDSNREQYSLEEVGLITGSNKSNGVDWDPARMIEEFHPTPIEGISYKITPMHVFSLFRKSGVDLRGFVSDGEMQIPDDAEKDVKELLDMYVGDVYSPVADPSML